MATLLENVSRLFGFKIERAIPSAAEVLPAVVPQVEDDGAVVVAAGGAYGTYVDLDGAMRTDNELISRYREMNLYPEVDEAVSQICNEAIVVEDHEPSVKINLDMTPFDDPIKQVIENEFQGVLKLLEWGEHCYDIFRRWYVDGRLYYQAIIDSAQPELGVQRLAYIDPRKIRKVREVKIDVAQGTNMMTNRTVSEYFIYSDKGFAGVSNLSAPSSMTNIQGAYKISKDSILFVTSGITDTNRSTVLGYLHKAIKPMNQLREMEDSTVVYRISRAPMRRVFYIEVGDLPKAKAEQYIQSMMTKHRNRVVYDGSTGEIRDDRKFMTMLDDYWLPRRNGQSGTQIETLQGERGLLQMEDVEYFKQKLNKSLNVPLSRLNPDTPFPMDPSNVISREEVNFQKFIDRIRLRFNHLFLQLLKRQLVLKKVLSEDDWDQVKHHIQFDYARDNFFAEMKDSAINRSRMELLGAMLPYAGKFYSFDTLRKKVLKQTDEDIEEETIKIMEEMKNPLYASLYFPVQAEQSTTPAPAGGSGGSSTSSSSNK